MEAFSSAIEQQKEDTLDITADMMRQYKGMQEQLLKKVSVSLMQLWRGVGEGPCLAVHVC